MPTRVLEAEFCVMDRGGIQVGLAVSPGPIGLPRSARPSVSADLLTPRTQSTWPRYLVGAALQRRRASQLAARLWKRPKCKSPPSLPPSFTQTSLSASTDCL